MTQAAIAILTLLALVLFRATVDARRRIESMERHTRDLQLLAEMSELLQLSATVDEVLELLPRYGASLFRGFDGSIYIVRTSPGELELATSWKGGSEAVDGKFLTFPMHAAGENMGVMTLSGPIAAVDRAVTERFCSQVGLTLSNLRRQEVLRTRAVRDPLTGLFNRRYMEEALVRELLRAERFCVQIGVIVLDVDHFKRFNDTWGHGGGDALLRQLARVMELVFRESDVVCRYGGEEFVIVVPDVTLDILRARVDHLRDEVRQMQIRFDGRLLGPVTVSAGIAVSPNHGMTVDALIANADRALYAAKSGGRDRSALPPPPEVAGRDAA